MTESDVADRLRLVFPAPAHVILDKVRNGTGYTKQTRTADALVLSVYPSRGLWMAGIEIKCNRGDWKRELANPDKADAIGKYCHLWYMAAPQGVVPIDELPEKWGLIEVAANIAKICKRASFNNEPKQLDMLLLCSILRTFSESMVPARKVEALVQKRTSEIIEKTNERHSHELNMLRDRVQEFENVSGVDLTNPWTLGRIGQAVKLIIDAGSPAEALRRLSKEMEGVRTALNYCQEILQADIR